LSSTTSVRTRRERSPPSVTRTEGRPLQWVNAISTLLRPLPLANSPARKQATRSAPWTWIDQGDAVAAREVVGCHDPRVARADDDDLKVVHTHTSAATGQDVTPGRFSSSRAGSPARQQRGRDVSRRPPHGSDIAAAEESSGEGDSIASPLRT